MAKIVIPMPDDMHVHLRQGEMLKNVFPFTGTEYGRALVMPNTDPPIVTAGDLLRYREDIIALCTGLAEGFEPLMTIKLTRQTTPDTVHAARDAGAVAIKFYPEGVTTNASGGYESLIAVPRDVLMAIEASRMVLAIHGEHPHAFCLDREAAFLPEIDFLLERYPRLRMTFEHITTAKAVDFVRQVWVQEPGRLGATITAHHLWITLDDVVGGKLDPHAFCKPLPKTGADREVLLEAATERWVGLSIDDPGGPFFFGSDSAPHHMSSKLHQGAAGAFTAPVALSLLAEIFEARVPIDLPPALARFTSGNGRRFYRLPEAKTSLTLETASWQVPHDVGGVWPFLAGRQMRWGVTRTRDPLAKAAP